MKLSPSEAWSFWRDILGAPRYVMAPMVNASEVQFRLLCSRYGTELAYTPMLHSRLLYEDKDYKAKFHPALLSAPPCPREDPASGRYEPTDDIESPYTEKHVIAQVCGHDPETVVRGCQTLEDTVTAIDLNCGCPQGIARRGKYGAYLLSEPDTILKIVAAMTERLKCPVTVKIRILDDIESPAELSAEDIADGKPGHLASRRQDVVELCPKTYQLIRELEQLGVAAICVHGRTIGNKGQAIRGADWGVIREIVRRSKIPIIANGSVSSKADADECLRYTGAAAVMSAEGLLANPAMFAAIDLTPATGPTPTPVSLMLELCYLYRHAQVEYHFHAPLKAHVFHALHPHLQVMTQFRDQLAQAHSVDQIEAVCVGLSKALREPDAAAPSTTNYYRRHQKSAHTCANTPEAKRAEAAARRVAAELPAAKKSRQDAEEKESAAISSETTSTEGSTSVGS